MKKLSYLAISILLHGAVIAILARFSTLDVANEPIQLELVGQPPSHQDSPSKPGRRHGGKASKSIATLPTGLGQKILTESGSSFRPSADAGESESGFAGPLNDNQLYSEGIGDVLGTNDNWAFHQQVFEKIDSELMFDSMLVRYNHFGSVYLEFSVSSKGYLLEKSLRASAQDSILKVHAVRALRRALGKEFETTKWSVLDKPIVFRAKFEFTQEGAELNFQKQKAFSQPVFVFRRASMEGDVASFVPRDGSLSVSMDYEEVLEKMKNRQKNKVLKAGQFDPFAHYKVDPAYNL